MALLYQQGTQNSAVHVGKVASLGAGSSCGALGPVSLEWRYGRAAQNFIEWKMCKTKGNSSSSEK